MPHAEQPSTERNMYEELGVKLFTPEPEGFDPRDASDRELLDYGYPPRPDAQNYPELHEHWNQLMSQPRIVIQPQFGNLPDESFGSSVEYGPITDFPGWSGSVLHPTGGFPFTSVSGVWTVPDTAPPRIVEGSYTYECATWVGIDGGSEDSYAPYLVQAGTSQSVKVTYYDVPVWGSYYSVSHTTYAWWEWLPDKSYQISNFPVSPGDVVACYISVLSPTEVSFHMWNMTTGILAPFRKSAPQGAEVRGLTAEWILECPHKRGQPVYMPKFGWVYFDYCIAGVQDRLFGGGDGAFQSLKDVNGRAVSEPVGITDLLFKIRYHGTP